MTRTQIDLDAYDAEEANEERAHLVGLTAAEKRTLKRALDCGSSGHVALAATWRTLSAGTDGRLHASCPVCHAHVSRSAFVN